MPRHPGDAVRVDGNFSYTFSDPGKLHVDGALKLAGVKVATAFVDYLTSGSLTFGGHLALGFPDFNAQDPTAQTVVGPHARSARLRAISKIGAATVTVRPRTRAGAEGPRARRTL